MADTTSSGQPKLALKRTNPKIDEKATPAARTPRQRAAGAWTGERPQRNGQKPSEAVHRSPPHSVEAEQGVLGSALISPKETIPECVEKIRETYFYVPAHRTIYEVMVDLWRKGDCIDLITFTQVLRDRNLLDSVGGAAFVTELFTFVPTAANMEYYLEIVRDKFILRELIASSTTNVRQAYGEQDDVHQLLDKAENRILSIGEEAFRVRPVRPMKDNVMEAIEQIEAMYDRKGLTGLSTGFGELDSMTSGLQNGELIVIASRPSMGKTSLALAIAEHVALNLHKGVAIFSLEMSVGQLTQRLLCSRARVNTRKVRDGFLADRDFPSLTAAAAKFSESRILIDDSASLSIMELRAKARRLRSQFKVDIVIVDYLQLLRSDSKRARENRQLEISEISAGLKTLAKELVVPVVVMAQLNRQPEARQGGRPRISDLRESGSIEQDADLVALLYRPEVYEEDAEARHEKSGEAELIVAKQRNGPIGEVHLTFIKEFTRFETRARNLSESDDEFR